MACIFWSCRSNNDLNVFDCSPLIGNLISGRGVDVLFKVDETIYSCYHMLLNGIYPNWSCLVQTIHHPQ